MVARLTVARDGILQQVQDPLPGAWFAEGAMTAMAKAIGFDGYCLFGVDPLTGIRSVMFARHGLTTATAQLLHNETVEHDANRYEDLVTSSRHTGVPARHEPDGALSPRLHDILRPDGYDSELRVALVADGRYSGALNLFRDDPRRPFTQEHADAAHELSAPLSLADPWDHGAVDTDVDRVVHEVAAAAAGRRPGLPLCRVRMPDGEWLVVSGSKVDSAPVDVVVVLRTGDVHTVAPAFADWCGLTTRERQVLELLASGPSAKQMARTLALSVFTLNDHLRSIYRKADVRGRGELPAQLC
jgi:DNA-binding CsgD family transcriptional regulator